LDYIPYSLFYSGRTINLGAVYVLVTYGIYCSPIHSTNNLPGNKLHIKEAEIVPYINKKLREPIDEKLDKLIERLNEMVKYKELSEKDIAGCLTYIVFKLIRRYYENGKWYSMMDAEKVCNSAIDEFKRRFLHPYEDRKIIENGDVR
jgi:hypothetical protein